MFVDLFEWIQTVQVGDLPSVPFEFHGPWSTIVDKEKFLKWLKSQGRDSVRARNCGALQCDLRRLYELCN